MLTEQAQKFFYARKRDRKGIPAVFLGDPTKASEACCGKKQRT